MGSINIVEIRKCWLGGELWTGYLTISGLHDNNSAGLVLAWTEENLSYPIVSREQEIVLDTKNKRWHTYGYVYKFKESLARGAEIWVTDKQQCGYFERTQGFLNCTTEVVVPVPRDLCISNRDSNSVFCSLQICLNISVLKSYMTSFIRVYIFQCQNFNVVVPSCRGAIKTFIWIKFCHFQIFNVKKCTRIKLVL